MNNKKLQDNIKLYESDLKRLPTECSLTFGYNDFYCIVKRQPSGHLCGYVELPLKFKDTVSVEKDFYSVHGGITYEEIDEFEETYTIGFDCTKSTDWIPATGQYGFSDAKYRDIDYVKSELKHLVDEIRKDVGLVWIG